MEVSSKVSKFNELRLTVTKQLSLYLLGLKVVGSNPSIVDDIPRLRAIISCK